MRSSIRVRYMWELPPMNSSRSSIVGDSKSSSAIEFSIHSIQQASSLSMPRNLGVSATNSHTSLQSSNNLPHQTWHMTSHFFTVQQLSTSSVIAHNPLESNTWLPHQTLHVTSHSNVIQYLTTSPWHCMWPHTPLNSNTWIPHQTLHVTSHSTELQHLDTSPDTACDLTLQCNPTPDYLTRHCMWPHTPLNSNTWLSHQTLHVTSHSNVIQHLTTSPDTACDLTLHWTPTPDYLTRHCMWPHTPM